jgi:hypothetical protein
MTLLRDRPPAGTGGQTDESIAKREDSGGFDEVSIISRAAIRQTYGGCDDTPDEWLEILDSLTAVGPIPETNYDEACSSIYGKRFDPTHFPLPIEKAGPIKVSGGESTSLLRDRSREPDSSGPCTRSKSRYLSTETADFAVFPPCKSRTCGPCKARKDESDYARIVHDLAGAVPYIADRIPPADWQRWRRWCYRQPNKPKAWSMGSSAEVGFMAVISEVQFDSRFRKATPGEIFELLERRTTANVGGKRVRFNLTGVNTTTATEWEAQIRPPKVAESESFQIHPMVTPDKLEAAAEALGIACKRFGTLVRFTPGQNKADLQRLRDYARNGKNPDSWAQMLAETQKRQGVLFDYDPGIECNCQTEAYCNACAGRI